MARSVIRRIPDLTLTLSETALIRDSVNQKTHVVLFKNVPEFVAGQLLGEETFLLE
jgi:hypothetical protein